MTCLARIPESECVEIVEDLWPVRTPSGEIAPSLRIVKRGKPFDHRIDPNNLSSDVWHRLDLLAAREGVERVYWPRNGFTRNIASMASQSFVNQIVRPGYTFYPGTLKEDRADGVSLEPNEGFYLSSGDCHTICARLRQTGTVIAVHGGRDNLLCPTCMKEGGNMHSIVDAIVDRLRISVDAHAWRYRQNISFDPAAVDVHIALGIEPEQFLHNHPDYRERTRVMVDYVNHEYGPGIVIGEPSEGRIDMPELITRQFERHGILRKRVTHDGIDTATATYPNSSSPLFHSNSRHEKSRNLSFVIRKW